MNKNKVAYTYTVVGYCSEGRAFSRPEMTNKQFKVALLHAHTYETVGNVTTLYTVQGARYMTFTAK